MRDQVFGELLEFEPRRQRHALSEGEHLAGAERGYEGEQVRGRIRHGGANDRLVAFVRHAHGEKRRALRDDGGVELCRALRDKPKEHTVFAAFLRDARDCLAGRTEPDVAVG